MEAWIPAAATAQNDFFGLGEDQQEARAHVADILASTARRHPSPLPLFVLRWRDLADVPLPVFFGLVDPGQEGGLVERWLQAVDAAPVEPPVLDEVPAPDGCSIRRALVYSLGDRGEVVVGVRYAVDTGNPAGVVLAHAASDAPSDVLSAFEDTETLLRTVRVTDVPQPPRQ